MTAPKVVAGFFSFTEVVAGEHRSYNQWHLYDHLPEQLPIPGIAWGQRWVLTPSLRSGLVAVAPLDRVHYVTLYLLGSPLDETLEQFRALAVRLRSEDRFHEHRTAHRSGPLAVESMHAAPRALVSAEAVAYRPGTGVHVRVEPVDAEPGRPEAFMDLPGVAGVWTFVGSGSSTMKGLRVTWCWLDGNLEPTAVTINHAVPAPDGTLFAATLATIDPAGPWDWFDR